jgi:hypothetical protein
MNYETTLARILAKGPCDRGWATLLKHLNKTEPDNEPLSLATILDKNGLSDAIWCLCAVPGSAKDARLFAVWCARQFQHLMDDPLCVEAIDEAERFAYATTTAASMSNARSRIWLPCNALCGLAYVTTLHSAYDAAASAAIEAVRCASQTGYTGHTDYVAYAGPLGDSHRKFLCRAEQHNRQREKFREMFCTGDRQLTTETATEMPIWML